jgi:hypothetical protein
VDREKNIMVNISRIEALAAAFARLNCVHDPFSKAFRLRNPLMLKAFNTKHEKDEEGYRVFNSFSAGWDNALLDLAIKCEGKSYSHLKPTDTLRDLVKCYGNDASATRSVKNFLRHALNNEEIYENTPLSYFLEDKENN